MYFDFKKLSILTGGGPVAVPRFPEDVEKLEKLSPQLIYRATVRRPRNAKHHRKFFAMIRRVVENTERWKSEDQLLVSLKFELQLVDLVEGFNGMVHLAPKSIKFEEMDQDEFSRSVYNPGVDLLAKEVGMSRFEFEELFKKYDRED